MCGLPSAFDASLPAWLTGRPGSAWPTWKGEPLGGLMYESLARVAAGRKHVQLQA